LEFFYSEKEICLGEVVPAILPVFGRLSVRVVSLKPACLEKKNLGHSLRFI
jgi:hypothetical protein